MTSLLLDFGASRVKSAILHKDIIEDIQSYNSIAPCIQDNNKFEVDLNNLSKLFRTIAEQYYRKYKFDNILLCSEMHGFIISDKNNFPLSNYISWKDERSKNILNGISTLDLLKNKLGKSFFETTGMNIRACYPIFNLFHLLREEQIHESTLKIISLPEWFCTIDKKSLNISHATMSAGLGFYNIYNKTIDQNLTNLFKEFDKNLIFNKVTEEIEIGGFINIENKEIPIYTGFGDHQCAVLGAGNNENTISLNLGTGSQIAMLYSKNNNCEKRPFFNKQNLSVITHIPSGRCLNAFINFLNEINPNKNFWEMLSDVKLEDIKKASLNFNMGLFSAAWNFDNYGSINNINENNFTLKNYLSSLLKSYLSQYEKGIEFLGKLDIHKKIIISGGIPLKIPVIKDYFQDKGYIAETSEQQYDETFTGLMKLEKVRKN